MNLYSFPSRNPAIPTVSRKQNARTGMMLIECLVYLGLFFLIMEVAFRIFYSCWDNAREFRGNSDEILNTLRIGERWRQDVRGASAPLMIENSSTTRILRIPYATAEIDYRFSENAIWRRIGQTNEWTRLLSKIKSSRMEADPRQRVMAWKWEVELDTRRKVPRVLPLFSFEAAPNNQQL